MALCFAIAASGLSMGPSPKMTASLEAPLMPAVTPTLPKHSHLNKVDHITYACQKGQALKWAWYHIEVEGGTLISRIDDVRPEDPDSSMLIWCIDHGSFGSVLIEGIDRKRTSQVSAFAERHGDHAVQHVAFDTTGLDAFLDFLFIDHVKELYLPDLMLALQCGLLAPGATVVADNVRTPGAPDYKQYMLEGDGARLFDTTVHDTFLEYSDTIPDEVLVSVLK